ncbi:MAG: IclR family transcriptional regulator [Pseudonocardia sp.]|nr:IclR family transcriptional regulator [Pseudonocardia sp.]
MSPGGRRSTTVKAVLHAIDVLDALHASARPLGVSDLARRTGLSKSTVHNLLVTLAMRRLVEQDTNAAWRVSWRLYELGAGLTGDIELARCARIHLDQLAEETGETALLGVLFDDEVLYIDKSEVLPPVPMVTRVGRRSPLHSSASGQVLLAYADEELRQRVLGGALIRRTPRTIVDADRLRPILAQVRADEFAKVDGENEVALSSISVPVFGPGSRLAAALTLAGPSSRFGPARTSRMVPALRGAAATISALLHRPEAGALAT